MDTSNDAGLTRDQVARRIANLPPGKLDLLDRLLKQRAGKEEIDRVGSITPRVAPQAPSPVSLAQERMLLVEGLFPAKATFTRTGMSPYKGVVNFEALRQALAEVVRRHEILRAYFQAIDGRFVQTAGSAEACFPVVDLRDVLEAEQRMVVYRLASEDIMRSFDLTSEVPLRTRMLLLGEDESLMLQSMHHIVFDARSTHVIPQEVEKLYERFSRGMPSNLEEPKIQYADFAVWQRQWLEGEEAAAQLSYWRQQLRGGGLLELASDRPRSLNPLFRLGSEGVVVPQSVTEALRALTRQEGVTLFMTVLAAFNALLHRHTGQTDISVGSLTFSRNRPELEGLVGPFINTLILRNDLNGHLSLRELIKRVRQVTLEAYAHSDLPIERLTEEVGRDHDRAPMVRVWYGLEKVFRSSSTGELSKMNDAFAELFRLSADSQNSFEALDIRKLRAGAIGAATSRKSFEAIDQDLGVRVTEGENELIVVVKYNSILFEAPSILRMLKHFHALLEAFAVNPDQQLWEAQILTKAERHQLLEEWNDTQQIGWKPGQTLLDLFDAQQERTPDAVAVVTDQEQMTYRELGRRVNQLAYQLHQRGFGPENLVAVVMRRSVGFLTSMLAAMKLGGAYLPVDPSDPPKRLRQIINRSNADLVLTSGEMIDKLKSAIDDQSSAAQPAIVMIENLDSSGELAENISELPYPQNLSYVIYTSGSTGNPKGSMIEHSGMLNHLFSKIRDLRLNDSDFIAQTASQTFDISVWQFLAPLLIGGRLRIVDDDTARDPYQSLHLARRESITVLEMVPSMLRTTYEEIVAVASDPLELPALRCVVVSGEAAPPKLCNDWVGSYPKISLVNAYGSTECSDDVTHCAIHYMPLADVIHAPVGLPSCNSQIHVLDQAGEVTPLGVIGELYIGGAGVGRGYLDDPGHTAEIFLPDFSSSQPGSRFYKTGDLGRRRRDGVLEFYGRLDHQVKIGGCRIELAEVETALGKHQGVNQVVVVAREDQPGIKRLIAYVVPREQPWPTPQDLRDFLREQLPDYMTPSAFVLLDTLPLTHNGKLDRRLLPAPGDSNLIDIAEWVAPSSPSEEKLARIWAEILKTDRISIYSNFFDLGGHSLMAIQVINRINRTFDVNLSLRSFFEEPTIAGLAMAVEEALIEKLEQETESDSSIMDFNS